MTDPTGRIFISYRRARSAEVGRLVQALHHYGIPTWQDITDLDEVPTEDRLREVIADPATSGGILWITPEIADSEIIRRVEVPELMRRATADDGFILLPVLAGGLDYSGLDKLFEGVGFADEIRNWNVRKVANAQSASILTIARRVLELRIAACHNVLAPDQHLRLEFSTRAPAPASQCELVVDWSDRLLPRPAPKSTWTAFVSSMEAIADAVRKRAPGRAVAASGLSSMPAVLALAAACSAVRGPELAWDQRTDGQIVRWALNGNRGVPAFDIQARGLTAGARDLSVAVSVTAELGGAIAASHSTLPSFRACVEVRPSGIDPSPQVVLSPIEGEGLARAIVAKMRAARATYNADGPVHLFVAGPLGLAVLLGRLLNTFGEIHSYEFLPGDTPPYVAAARIWGTR